MIYRIVCDGMELYGPNIEQSVLNPHLEIELNSAGSLEFTLPVVMGDKEDGTYGQMNNDQWSEPKIFKSEVEVWEGDRIIWFGRPLQITRDWNNQRKVVCEGALAYFNDSIQRTYEMKPSAKHTNRWFFSHEKDNQDHTEGLIQTHNDQVETNRQFEVREVSVEEEEAYRKTDYNTTYDCIQNMCLATNGGYIILEKEYDEGQGEHRYISWVQNMPYGSNQPVQFGLNLLDINQDLNGADVCTVLIPTGSDDLDLGKMGYKNEDGVTHEKNSDEIYITSGVDLEGNPFTGIDTYGRVVQQKSWSEFTSGNENGLWLKAKEWLIEKNKDVPTIECSAADLHYIEGYSDSTGADYDFFRVGMKVIVTSGPHGIDRELIIYKLSMDLDSGVKRVTIGTPPKRELTDIIAPNSGSGATRGNGTKGNGDGGTGSGGSGGGSVSIPVKDVRVKLPGETEYKTAVSKKVAKIDLSAAGKVDDVKVDGTSVVDENRVANITIPVKDVTLEGSSVVDQNGNAVLDEVGKVKDVKVDGSSVVDANKNANISIPVKGVRYDGIDVVDPVTKIANINSSDSIGRLTDKYFYDRAFEESETSNTRMYTITEDGVYLCLFYDCNPRISTPPNNTEYTRNGYWSISTDATVMREVVLPYPGASPSFSEIASCGKFLICDCEAGDTVTFYKDNNRYLIAASTDPNPNPSQLGWYEFDETLNKMVATHDSFEVEGKNYYRTTSQLPGLSSGSLEWVVKLSNIDKRYLTFLDVSTGYSSVGNGTGGFSIPNDDNVYCVVAISRQNGNGLTPTYPVANVVCTPTIDESTFYSSDVDSFVSLMQNYKMIMHIGDGTYRQEGENYNVNNVRYQYDSQLSRYVVYDSVAYAEINTGRYFNSISGRPYASVYNNGVMILAMRLSKPPGILDVVVNGSSVVDNTFRAVFNCATPADIATLQSNFQAGVDDIYDACVAKGSTPASTALSDVVAAIYAISGSGGGGIDVTRCVQVVPLLTDEDPTVVTADSQWSSRWAPWKALDGDDDTAWISDTYSSYPAANWIKIVLSQPVIPVMFWWRGIDDSDVEAADITVKDFNTDATLFTLSPVNKYDSIHAWPSSIPSTYTSVIKIMFNQQTRVSGASRIELWGIPRPV